LHIACALMKGVSRDDPKNGARAVPAGEARNFAPGRLRASYRPALRPAREVLAALAPGRVLPFAPGNSRKRGPELSQEVKALVSAAVGRGEASGLAHSALPHPPMRPRVGLRLPALRLPSLLRRAVRFCRGAAQLGCENASRECFVIASEAKQSSLRRRSGLLRRFRSSQ